MRFFLTLSYKGTAYHGWQIQPNAPSVQQTLQEALSTILREKIEVVGAGRTDTGVHASHYIAHFDTENPAPLEAVDFCYHLNAILPKDIAASEVRRVKQDAHARFDALQREYRYRIIRKKNPFRIDTACLYTAPLDAEKMNRAAELITTYEDFTSFCKLHADNKTNICHVTESHWREENGELTYTISADRFLRNMVRAIVGTLLDVGRGKITLEQFKDIIEARSRGEAGSSAAAHGLFLTGITYPHDIYL